MQIILGALFCAILYLATMIAGVAVCLKEVGEQLYRIAFWTEWVCDGNGKEQNKEDG